MSKVIKIIDHYNIIVSRDEMETITKKDILQIYIPLSNIHYEEVDYGVFDFIKAELRIKAVYPKMILCENNNYTKTKIQIKSIFENSLDKEEQTEPQYEEVENIVPLPIDPSCIDRDMNVNSIRFIKLGDLVRKKN